MTFVPPMPPLSIALAALRVDKVASATLALGLDRHVRLTSNIPAEAGVAVVVRVLDDKTTYNQLEDVHGRMRTVHRGDIVVGVLGHRRALRGYSGDVPKRVEPGDVLHLLNLGGVIGRCSSASAQVGPAARVEVLGAVDIEGRAASLFPGRVPLRDALGPMPPVVFMAGSCMHAGKTAAACTLIRHASERGLRVGAVKLTGVALRRDLLEMEDHGAERIASFVDAGLPSTCHDLVAVVRAARGLLSDMAGLDLVVAELGDGLLGDYGVGEILSAPDIGRCAAAVVLAAADPVAAYGGVQILHRFGVGASVVTGPATDNTAGSDSVTAATGVVAVNARHEPKRFGAQVLGAAGVEVGP